MTLTDIPIPAIKRFLQFTQSTYVWAWSMMPSETHERVAIDSWNRLRAAHATLPIRSVLDVGCGTGRELEMFRASGARALGVTVNEEDAAELRSRGFDILIADQNFTDLPDNSFDLVWSRHCLEHSVAPFYTIAEYARIVKPNCICYVEVPEAGTRAKNEWNPNHYSLMPKVMWEELFVRVGFQIVERRLATLDVAHEGGEQIDAEYDTWVCYFLRKVPQAVQMMVAPRG